MDLLAGYPAALCTVQDAESAILFTPLPQTPSTCALMSYKRGWHVKDSNVPSEQTALELLAVHPAAQLTRHDAELYSLHSRRECCPHSRWVLTP